MKNPSLFDGEVLSIKSVEKLSNEIEIQLEKTHYSHMTYIMNHRNKKMTKYRAVVIGGYLITSDGYYAFGKMAQKTSFPWVIQCIGGGLAKEDIIDGDLVRAF